MRPPMPRAIPTGTASRTADGDGLAVGLGVGLGLAVADALALALRGGTGSRRTAGSRRPAGSSATRSAPGDGLGSGRSAICTVLMLMKPEFVFTAVASSPCDLNTASTWSGVTFGSWNRISQVVPPV